MIKTYIKSRPIKITDRPEITKEYTGYIVYFEGKKKIWTLSCGVRRITKYDALQDAMRLRSEQRSDFI